MEYFPMSQAEFDTTVSAAKRIRKRRPSPFIRLGDFVRQHPIPDSVYRHTLSEADGNSHVWDEGGERAKWWLEVMNGARRAWYDGTRRCMFVE